MGFDMKLSEYLYPFFMTIVSVLVGMVLIGLGVVFLAAIFNPTEEQQAQMHKTQIISEVDGCKVYRFYDGNYHYVTRCGDKVTTQKNWSESCGKACTRRRTEELVTEKNQ
jgi:hypothetical protein